MKPLLQLIRRLFSVECQEEKPVPKRTASETPPELPPEAARQPARAGFTDDDSPPGHKIRWH